MDYAPVNLRDDPNPNISNLITEVIRLAARDALELGDRLSAVHIGCAFECLQSRCEDWRKKHPEKACEEFQQTDFDRVRELLAFIGFGW
jgi:hypothetical protein